MDFATRQTYNLRKRVGRQNFLRSLWWYIRNWFAWELRFAINDTWRNT